jgi:hypothetical protein
MTIDRPYQKALPLDKALEVISGFIGSRYDGKVVAALKEACRHGEVANGVVRQRVQTGRGPEHTGDIMDDSGDILEIGPPPSDSNPQSSQILFS